MIDRFGADATRMYALFAAPPDRDLDWQEDGVAGIVRFIGKIYRLVTKYATFSGGADEKTADDELLLRKLHQTLAKITLDFSGRWHFNTSISSIMILVNEMTAKEAAIDEGRVTSATVRELMRSLVQIIAPFAPFVAAELWERLGQTGVVFRTAWPEADAELARESEMEIPVQVNGKLVVVVKVAADSGADTIKAAALNDDKVQVRVAGKTVVKVVVVPGKLVNLVVK
jgi:leucyl-tRNA synthetase